MSRASPVRFSTRARPRGDDPGGRPRGVARAAIAVIAAILAGCAAPPREPVPITPPSEVASAPVARLPVVPAPSRPAIVPVPAPATPPATPAAPAVASSRIDPASVPAGAIYVCENGSGANRRLTAIQFDPKVGDLCRRHPEMGPCQYERNLCRQSGGRVYAADGREITMATEAEFDRKVMRVRFKSN